MKEFKDEKELYERYLLGLNFIESSLYGDDEIAEMMLETMSKEDLADALALVAGSYLEIAAGLGNSKPEEAISKMKTTMLKLINK